jgi:hypothetical protein
MQMNTPEFDMWDDEGRFPMLRVLLANFARTGSSFGVALYVDGKVISGHAVGRPEWLRRVAGADVPGESRTAASVRQQLRGIADDDEQKAPEHATEILHVRLVDVTIQDVFEGRTEMPQLEVALARVSGWSLSDTPRRS